MMKPFRFLFFTVLLLFINQEEIVAQPNTKMAIKIDSQKEVDSLIKHLNEWFKDELDLYERPEAYPENRITSGETNGWILVHKEKLKELGATVKWNKDKKEYELEK